MTAHNDLNSNISEPGRDQWYKRYAMFMNYVSWASLRLSVKIHGEGSRDFPKEASASAVKGHLILINIFSPVVLACIIFHVECKPIGKTLFITTGIISYCIYLWIDFYEKQYYSIFSKLSVPERKKWDLYALTYVLGSWAIFSIILLLLTPLFQ